MKKEHNLTPIIRFLIPIMCLYGMFFALTAIEDGILSLIYGMVVLLCGCGLYVDINEVQIKLSKIAHYAFIVICLIYVVMTVTMVTDYFAL